MVKIRQKKLWIPVVVILLGLIVLFHFVPVYSRTGWRDYYGGGLCSGYNISSDEVLKDVEAHGGRIITHRIILNGFWGFMSDRQHLHKTNECFEPVKLQLYLW
jgi:hypothetical protein